MVLKYLFLPFYIELTELLVLSKYSSPKAIVPRNIQNKLQWNKQ